MIKVAIVEENKTVRESLKTLIALAPGCECLGAWSAAEEAWQTLHDRAPDVVLLDVQLGKIQGAECTACLKQRYPAAQIILLTVYEDPERIYQALRAGATGYLLKRSTPEQIVGAILQAHKNASSAAQSSATAALQNSPFGELGSKPSPVTLAGEP